MNLKRLSIPDGTSSKFSLPASFNQRSTMNQQSPRNFLFHSVKPSCFVEQSDKSFSSHAEARSQLIAQRQRMDQALQMMSNQQTEKLQESIIMTRQHRKRSTQLMPVIRVSYNDPEQEHLKSAFKIIKDQNHRFQESQKYEDPKKYTQSVPRLPQTAERFHNIDASEFLQIKHDNNMQAQQAIDENKQVQILLQKQLNNYKTLKDVNEQFFYTPKGHQKYEGFLGQKKTTERNSQYSQGYLSNSSQRDNQVLNNTSSLLTNQKSVIAGAVFLPRKILQSSQHSMKMMQTSQNFKDQIASISMNRNSSLNKITDLLTERQEDQASPQKVVCINDRFKLNYDKDCFMRFYKLKQSLQSQNILFNQLQQQQMLNKGSLLGQVENSQDFFVNVKLVENSELIRHIVIGSTLVIARDRGYIFGGKSIEQKRLLTTIAVDTFTANLRFHQIANSQSEVFNRYGHQAHEFQGKILIIGGEYGYSQGQKNMRTLLGDIVFFDPRSLKHQTINFYKPLKKVRAIGSCVLGKYLYYFGGMLDNGQVVNDLVRINLTQNSKGLFKWKRALCNKQACRRGIELPKLAYTKMCIVYYESKLKKFEGQLEQFHLSSLSDEVDWQYTQNYISIEGIYMFGGFNYESIPVNDLYIIQVDPKKIHTWLQPQTKGKPPAPRFMHSLDYYAPSNVLILCGGRNDHTKTIYNDMFVLFLDSLTWTEVSFCSQKLKPRFNFISLIKDTKLLILGGQTTEFQLAHDYEVVELDQEINFTNHASKYLFKKMAAFIKANFQQKKLSAQEAKQAETERNIKSQEQIKSRGGKSKKNRQDIINGLIVKAQSNSKKNHSMFINNDSQIVSPTRKEQLSPVNFSSKKRFEYNGSPRQSPSPKLMKKPSKFE